MVAVSLLPARLEEARQDRVLQRGWVMRTSSTARPLSHEPRVVGLGQPACFNEEGTSATEQGGFFHRGIFCPDKR